MAPRVSRSRRAIKPARKNCGRSSNGVSNYCPRHINEDGVVTSDSDEPEGRFPAGKANLNASSLYFDALNSAQYLGRDLGKPSLQLQTYRAQAQAMQASIEKYFGARVEGFDTYRYYAGNDVLRSWICVPLTMGIFERKTATLDALFSPRLWMTDGLLTQAGDKMFWDRSTLYGLRGAFAAGAFEQALKFLTAYSNRRLLGEHVEAYPEGNQRHLSAESALYCRIYTEGLFGIRPTGLRSFACPPQLPQGWNSMQLNRIHAFGTLFDLVVNRTTQGAEIQVIRDGKIKKKLRANAEQTVNIELN